MHHYNHRGVRRWGGSASLGRIEAPEYCDDECTNQEMAFLSARLPAAVYM